MTTLPAVKTKKKQKKTYGKRTNKSKYVAKKRL